MGYYNLLPNFLLIQITSQFQHLFMCCFASMQGQSEAGCSAVNFICVYFPFSKQTERQVCISEVIRSSRRALRADLGYCKVKIDALSEGQQAVFTFF